MKLLQGLFLALVFVQPLQSVDTSKIIVTGQGTISKPSDQFNLTLGVETIDADIKKATSMNAERMSVLVEGLKRLGLESKELRTGSYTIIPQYTPRPRNPPADWLPSIIGYQIQNTLSVKTTRLDLVQKIIEGATALRANQIQNLHFDLYDYQSATEDAIQLAVLQARAYAEAAALAARTSLGQVLEISVNAPPQQNPPLYRTQALTYAKEVSTPILSGDLEITATATVTYSVH